MGNTVKNYDITSILVFGLFLQSARCFFFWKIDLIYSIVTAIYFLRLFFISKRRNRELNYRKIQICICLILFNVFYVSQGINSFIVYVLTNIPILYLLVISNNELSVLLKKITLYYSLLLLLSITIYLLLIFGLNIPNIGIVRISEDSDFLFNNYLLYIKPVFSDNRFSIQRFNGFLQEPGHISMLSVLLLFANRFNLRKWTSYILLLSIVLSFSLAGYILLLLSVCLYVFFIVKNIKYKCFAFFLVLIFILLLLDNDFVRDLVVSRAFNQETLSDSLSNRSGVMANVLYENMNVKELFLGIDNYTDLINSGLISGNSYKLFILRYGLLGCVFPFIFYFIFVFYSRNKIYSLLFFGVIIICFLQRTYPWWYSWIFTYISGIARSEVFDNYSKLDHHI